MNLYSSLSTLRIWLPCSTVLTRDIDAFIELSRKSEDRNCLDWGYIQQDVRSPGGSKSTQSCRRTYRKRCRRGLSCNSFSCDRCNVFCNTRGGINPRERCAFLGRRGRCRE